MPALSSSRSLSDGHNPCRDRRGTSSLRPFPSGRKVSPKKTDLFIGVGPRQLSRRNSEM